MTVSVIIPVLNEESTIADVVQLVQKTAAARSKPNLLQRLFQWRVGLGLEQFDVREIIVVDDHSIDETVSRARNAGATVITSTQRGKGSSMREGLLVSRSEIVVFLDGDIGNYAVDVVELLARPIARGEAEFVKATFDREAGRVTELVAKPLLGLLFPEAQQYSQPLSGMIAGRRDWLLKTEFENDYGVDIGILLDMISLGARIREVNIGSIENKMKQWHQLSPMARDVARAILKRVRRRPSFTLERLATSNVVLDQLEGVFRESARELQKMVIFDLDNTIFMGRFIERVAEAHGFQRELLEIVTTNQDPFLITKLIARLLKGLDFAQLVSVADGIQLVSDTAQVVSELRERGYIVGILSDGYEFVAQHVANKIGADFAIANMLEFVNGVSTGEVQVPSHYVRGKDSLCSHSFCKSNVLLHLSGKYGIPLENMIAVGDSDQDICMIKYVGIGVAFCSESKLLNMVADRVLTTRSFLPLLEFAQ